MRIEEFCYCTLLHSTTSTYSLLPVHYWYSLRPGLLVPFVLNSWARFPQEIVFTNVLISGMHVNMWMWGTITSCIHAKVTRTHGRKNARDATMHAHDKTHTVTLKCSTYTCMHTHTQPGWASDRMNTGKCIYSAQWAYYEVQWPYFYKYTVTDSVFISFEIKSY